MKFTNPIAILIAETHFSGSGLSDFLAYTGAAEAGYELDGWASDSELLIELAGRLCYKSWAPGVNPNVTKVRTDSKEYLANILRQRHGAVLEHATCTWVILNCSRVFTHELVRHRLCAFSQESLRFVRLTDLAAYLPQAFSDDPETVNLMQRVFEHLESVQQDLADSYGLDDEGADFTHKKKVTSAMRRLAPIGLATNIMFTTNHRNLRHMIAQRTSVHAEEEIRKVFLDIAEQCQGHWPLLYQDMTIDEDGAAFANDKV